jgi:hypothetical protein
MKVGDMRCQMCGARGSCEEVPRHKRVSTWVFLLTGILPSVLHTASRPTKIKCNSCGGRFSIRSGVAILCLILFWLLIGAVIATIALW